MNRFMIGQFGKFDKLKQKKDFKQGFYGVEACSMESEKEIINLYENAKKNNYKIAVHFPLRAGKWRLRDAQYLSKDEEIKRQSYEYIENELKYIRAISPQYVLFHYPKPVLLDSEIDWENWRFQDETEYYFDNEYSYEKFITESEEFFRWLSYKSEEYNFTPVLEFDALNKYVCGTNIVEELLEKYPRVKICLDIARLHLQSKIDYKFHSLKIVKKFAKYAEVIHVSNGRAEDNASRNHLPALRTLSKEEGYANIKEYFDIIKKENNECKILFEHRSDLISDDELEDCYKYIYELLNC
ncbi:TIM barrel protein [Haloimpatiens sp. FM7315]|uniref:TIM barrel protein n=1 Tax=Haloimpatiens sp. FM7315 TaxID=3298609 RepID=UPI00370A2C1C